MDAAESGDDARAFGDDVQVVFVCVETALEQKEATNTCDQPYKPYVMRVPLSTLKTVVAAYDIYHRVRPGVTCGVP